LNTNAERVAIIGLGYVGLPLAMQVLSTGKKVIGIDISASLIKSLNEGVTNIEGVNVSDLKLSIESGDFVATTDFSQISICRIVVITVPTPLDDEQKPDLSMLRSACVSISDHILAGTLVINESTSFPGTLREFICSIFERNSTEIYETLEFACSPERVDPGNKIYGFSNTPRNVSGITQTASKRTYEFYSTFVDNVEIVESPEVAELAKLIENSYRLLNISFVNELKKYCQIKSISLIDAIQAASTKPYGFAPFWPSAGAGGHCIPVDPRYLIEDAREKGVVLSTLECASQANILLADDVANFCMKILGSLMNKNILVEGIAYKSNVSDIRESAALRIFRALEERGARVRWHDPIVETLKVPGFKDIGLSEFDLVVVCVVHDQTNLKEMTDEARLIIDLTGNVPKSKNTINF
jgi:UDP-N-acetyl-D-glucosamine dehydrogenase